MLHTISGVVRESLKNSSNCLKSPSCDLCSKSAAKKPHDNVAKEGKNQCGVFWAMVVEACCKHLVGIATLVSCYKEALHNGPSQPLMSSECCRPTNLLNSFRMVSLTESSLRNHLLTKISSARRSAPLLMTFPDTVFRERPNRGSDG